MLDAEEEYIVLAKNWKERGDLKSAHKLVTSHLRTSSKKLLWSYKGYGLPVSELISEGNIGLLLQAVKKFDPDKGFQISNLRDCGGLKQGIQEYVLRSWRPC